MPINLEDWLLEVGTGTGTDSMTGIQGSVPTTQPDIGGMPPQQGGQPSIANPSQGMGEPPQKQQKQPDPSSDPQLPDMPEEKDEKDFEAWKKEFIVESIKGDVPTLKDMISQVIDRDLDSYQFKFVHDNLQILLLRENSNIEKACSAVRKLLKEEIDHNNPATTTVNHIHTVLAEQPLLNNIFIKLTGLRGIKGEMHRQFIAALLGAVQVGAGAYNEDLIYDQKDYSMKISTRMNARFGEVHLGEWSLKQDDPERYLKPPELKRLSDGSPEEKTALRKRIICESIATKFEKRAFIINVVGPDGTIYSLGWDFGTSLRAAYTEGKLVVNIKADDNGEAMIDEDGAIVNFLDMKINYIQEMGDTDEEGKPAKKEVEFIHRRYGQLFLTAQLPTIKEASGSMQGISFKSAPWTGSPTDLKKLQSCIPSLSECLLRQCT
jgi:hypothetical protein